MGDEGRLVLDNGNEEAWRFHQENPDGAFSPPRATLLTEPNWDPKGNGLPLSDCYKRGLLQGSGKGIPKQKSLNVVQVVQQGLIPIPGKVKEIPGDGKQLPHWDSKLWAHR